MKKKGIIDTQLYAGQMARTIADLLRLKEDLRLELEENGFSLETASDKAEQIYEAAWEYVNHAVIE